MGCCKWDGVPGWPCICLAWRGGQAPVGRWLCRVRFLPRYLKPGSWLLGGRAGAAAACVTRMRNRNPDWGRVPMATGVVALETNLQAASPQGPLRAGPQLPAEALGRGGDQALSQAKTGRLTLQGHKFPGPQPWPHPHSWSHMWNVATMHIHHHHTSLDMAWDPGQVLPLWESPRLGGRGRETGQGQ